MFIECRKPLNATDMQGKTRLIEDLNMLKAAFIRQPLNPLLLGSTLPGLPRYGFVGSHPT